MTYETRPRTGPGSLAFMLERSRIWPLGTKVELDGGSFMVVSVEYDRHGVEDRISLKRLDRAESAYRVYTVGELDRYESWNRLVRV